MTDTHSSTEMNSIVGSRVRQARESSQMTLRALATGLGVSPATVSAIENGHTGVNVVRIARIAEVLDVSVAHLLGQDGGLPSEPRLPETTFDGTNWRTFGELAMSAPLRAAVEVFNEVGYHGSSVRMIAERCNLSVAGLYYHHSSKQQMLVEIMGVQMSDLLARCSAAVAESEDPRERFTLLVECLVLFHTYRRKVGFIGASEMRSLEAASRDEIIAARVAMQRMIDDEIDRCVNVGVFATPLPREAGRAINSMCTAVARWFRPDGPISAELVANRYVQLALAMVQADPRL